MAEALGIASGVIAVIDITVKAGSTYVKLTRLWDEVKQVPETLRAQTEEIRDLEDYLLDVEAGFATSPLPEFAPNRALLERHIAKCRLALDELKDAVDDVYAQVTKTRGFRSKIAATKAVLRKDDHNALTSKLGRALKLFQLAQAQERRWIAVATFTAMVDAGSRERLPNAPYGTSLKLPRKKPTAILPYMNTGSEWFSMLGSVYLGHDSNDSFQLSYRAPTWLTQTVYSLLAQKEVMGWQINLRAYEVVEDFGVELQRLIEDDDATAVSKYLSEHEMTPYARNPHGGNLLRTAAFFDAYEVTKFLMRHDVENYAAEIFDRSSCPWLFVILTCRHRNFQMLDLLNDFGLSDFIDTLTPHDFGAAFTNGITLRNYQAFLDRSGLQNHWLSISERLTGALSVVISKYGLRWRLNNLHFLLPEISTVEGLVEVLQLSKGISMGSLIHTLAIGMALMSRTMEHCDYFVDDEDEEEDAEEEERRWTETLVVCIEAAPTVLQHLETFVVYDSTTLVECTPLAAIITNVVDRRSEDMPWPVFSTKFSLVNIRAFFRLWIETVAAAGVDLLSYGREEKRLQEAGSSTILQRLCVRERQGLFEERWNKIDSRASIVGITYGSLPSQWQLWIVDNDYEYAAGEFWEMVEAQEFSIPGDWVDPVDEWEETDRWLRETPPPLIWSEYRNIRPPV